MKARTSAAPHHDCSASSAQSSLATGGGMRNSTSRTLRASSCAASLAALPAGADSSVRDEQTWHQYIIRALSASCAHT